MNRLSYSTLWDGYASASAAKAARDARWRELRKRGIACRRSVLTNQLKKYDGFMQPNGGTCDVYEIYSGAEIQKVDA